ncbi:MAG: TetM/TetW/TetO/TetS family tetracycline resistance ribosomal protection protein, partial [Oscillospiraceae bacterium]|nr:TetM/TetW/TetO/TetS family tetracycline resistance ribosomal protection protein [Oscillospiraceae bacterium]
FGDMEATLLDTPGHVDFCAEMERTLQVLDYAILVISGTDGVQSHTRTLWRLLERYSVPTFLFVNKMDLANVDRESVLAQLQKLGPCVDFAARDEEELSLCDEAAMEEYLESGALSDDTLARLIAERKLFPCFFGSALKLDGVEEFLAVLERYTRMPHYGEEFAARVFNISRDAQGTRLSHLKILGGSLKAKTLVSHGESEEKIDQLRLYSGQKFVSADSVDAGSIVAVTGLEQSFPGEGLGKAERGEKPMLESVLTYRVLLPEGADAHTVLPKLRQLEDEDPQLAFLWEEKTQEIHVRLMGQIQLEILQRLILDRFGLEVSFGSGRVVYRETIESAVEGVGHFEPLRHYAEVRLLLEPLPRGSGVQFASACPTDALDLNWQRLIYTHIFEREHPGVLTGSALTDVRITLLAGRAHLKHTEGGDFRQSTYRAIRQGLMEAKSILLEPYYDFRMELPVECVGRAMSDVQMMGGSVEPAESEDELSLLVGFAPVESMRNYYAELAAYTRGRGRLSCTFRGFEPCREQEKIVAEIGYDPERDTDNPTGSVFCAHGAGDYV